MSRYEQSVVHVCPLDQREVTLPHACIREREVKMTSSTVRGTIVLPGTQYKYSTIRRNHNSLNV